MHTSFNFGTYNVGQGWDDYRIMLGSDSEESSKLQAEFKGIKSREEEQAKSKEMICKVEETVAQKLADDLDVISLQELSNLDRPFAKTLLSKGFQIYHLNSEENSNFSTAVAIRSEMFQDVVNDSFKSQSGEKAIYGQEIAAVEATLKDSGIRLRFSSLHSWGFQLYHPTQKKKDYFEKDNQQAGYAIHYAKEAVTASKKSKADYSFIGGDMNNNLDNIKQGFKVFQDNNYSVMEADEATNVNSADEILEVSYKYRKIDYLFAKMESKIKKIWNGFLSLFKSTRQMTTSRAKVLKGYDFKLETNCSDHKPVASTITITTRASIISRV